MTSGGKKIIKKDLRCDFQKITMTIYVIFILLLFKRRGSHVHPPFEIHVGFSSKPQLTCRSLSLTHLSLHPLQQWSFGGNDMVKFLV